MQEEQLVAFFKKAKTRGGVAWKVEHTQKDSSGEITHISGYVEEFEDNQVVKIPMVWNVRGGAVYHVLLKYDLIVEDPIYYGNQELQDAPHDPVEGNPPQN